MIKFFKKNKSFVIDIFIILLLGILSVTWFKGDYLINGGDFAMPFDWVKYLRSMFSIWHENSSMGAADYRNIASLIPYALIGSFFQSLGFSLVFIEKLFFYFWFIGGGLSMYFLVWVLGMKRLGRITSAIFYMLNPFSLIIIWHISHALIQMPYAFAPLYLGLYIYGLKNKKGLKYIVLSVLLWLFTTTSAYAWPAAVFIHWLPIFFYFLIEFFFNRKNRLFAIKFSLKFLAIWLAFNFYWLFPFIESMTESFTSAHSPVIMSDLQTLKLTSVKILDGLRMMGFWSLHSGYKGEPYYLYEAFYRLPIIKVIGWLIPIFVLLGFFHQDVKKKKIIYFYSLVILFGLVGMSGAYLPLGISKSLLWLYKTFPSLNLLARFAFLFFGIQTYLIFAVLFGYGVMLINSWGMKRVGKIIFLPLTIFFILLFVVLVWPFWNGQVIRSDSKIWPGERVKIPGYWWEAREWLTEQKDFFRILPLPMSKTYNVALDWEEGYTGGDPIRWLSPQSFLFVNTGETFKIPELIGSLVEEETEFKDLDKLLGFLNVKYLLLREDIRWDFLRGHNWWFKQTPANVSLFLNQQKDLTLVKEIGKIKFYEIKQDYLLPHIYVPQKLTLVNGKAGSFIDIVPFLKPDEKEAVIISKQNEGKDTTFDNQFDQSFIWQEPIFLLKGVEKIPSLEDAANSLPYARILPTSRLYVLIQIKEYLSKLFSSLSKRIELEITFTGKRLKEAYDLLGKERIPLIPGKNYSLKETNIKLTMDIINRSILGWQDIDKQIKKINDESLKEEINKKINDQVLSQLTFLKSLEEGLTSEQYSHIYATSEMLEKILEEKREKDVDIAKLGSGIVEKIDSKMVIYKIEITQSDNYGIYIRDDTISKYYDLSRKTISFIIDNDNFYEMPIKFNDGNSIFLGNFNFESGYHEIKILTPSSINLISDPSFEQGVWSGATPVPSSSRSEIAAVQSTDAFQGEFSLKVSSKQNNAAVFTPINNFRYGDIYKVSFAVKHVEGSQPIFAVWENDTKLNVPNFDFKNIGSWGTADPLTFLYVFKPLKADKNWRQYEFILKPQDATQFLGLVFFSLQPKIGETVNLYDDVRVERIFTNPILLKSTTSEKIKQIPDIEFKKINQTKYQVEIKNAIEPYFLVFSEAFHPGWTTSVEGEHFMINGFANGWYIRKTGDYKIIINFDPQKIYYISISISVFAFLATIIFLLIKKKKNEG